MRTLTPRPTTTKNACSNNRRNHPKQIHARTHSHTARVIYTHTKKTKSTPGARASLCYVIVARTRSASRRELSRTEQRITVKETLNEKTSQQPNRKSV